MTAVVTEAPALDERDELIALIALTACGVNSYPGKTKACERHRKQGEAILNIASSGALDALAATICGSEKMRSCTTCVGKAVEVMHVYNEGAKADDQ